MSFSKLGLAPPLLLIRARGTIMSFIKGLSAVVLVVAVSSLVGCGGSSHGSERGGLTSCTPAEAPVGASVTCESGKLEDDSTLFVGNKPVDFTYDAEALTVSFQVPAVLPGTQKITSQSGDSGVRLIDSSFKVIAKPTADAAAPAGETPVAANDGDVILPSGETSVPSSDIPSDYPSNPAPEIPAEPAAPAGPADVQTFNVEKVAGASLSTYRVTWSVTGAKAAYLWGNALNRTDKDKDSPEDARCGLTVDGRYLAVNSDGNKLSAGSPNYDKYKAYTEGVLCKNTDDVTTNNCEGSAEPFVEPAPVDDQPQTDSEDVSLQGITFNKSAMNSAIRDTVNLTSDHAPSCRIDLTAFSGEFFTRSLAKNGKICLAIQGSDDVWSVQCRGVDAPKAAFAESDSNVIISTERPVVILDFNYFNATSAPKAEGCVETSPSSPSTAGAGHYRAECKIKKDSMKVSVEVQGIGKGNVEKRSYRIDFAKPEAVMKLYGAPLLSNKEGEMKLQYTASRAYTVTDLRTDTVISPEGVTCPWVNGIHLYGQYVIDGVKKLHPDFFKVEKAADAQAVVTVYRDAYNYFWSFGAYDFDGFPKPSNVVGPEQTSEFSTEVSIIDGTYHEGEGCAKHLDWVHVEDHVYEDKFGQQGAQDLAYDTLGMCESDLSCYKEWVKWAYNGSHTVGFVLNVTNVQSLDVECRQNYKKSAGGQQFVYDAVIKSYHQDSTTGYSQVPVNVTDISPVIACKVVYKGTFQPNENGQITNEAKFEMTDSCIGHDYGSMDLSDVKTFLIGKGVVAEDIPF